MPDLVFEQVTSLLKSAQRDFDARNYETAAATLNTILAHSPEHYWALLLLARTCREQGNVAAAAQCLRTAIGLTIPERIGAYFDLAVDAVAAQRVHEAEPLVDDALRLPESGQTRWYKGRLLFLRGLIELGKGRPATADKILADAYQFSRSIDEIPLLFGWVRDAIIRTSNSHLTYLSYLAGRIGMADRPIAYREELAKFGAETVVVAIGAMDGVRFDPLWEFIQTRKWRAVLVEPTAAMFRELTRNYADCSSVRCAQMAITDHNGPVVIHRIRSDAVQRGLVGEWALGVSSLSIDSTLKFYRDLLETETVEGRTFLAFIEQYGIDHIDILQIDTEGHDYIVFRQVPLQQLRVKLLRVELINVDPVYRLEVFEMLRTQGYRYHFDGNDVTAVPAETFTQTAASRKDAAISTIIGQADPSKSVTSGREMWIPHYARNIVPPGMDHREFGVPVATTSITDPRVYAPFSRTIISMPNIVFPPSTEYKSTEAGESPDARKYLAACHATFSCGFSQPVTAIGFLPDHALCFESDDGLRLLEESLWHSDLFFSKWFRNDLTTGWRWRVDRSWPAPRRVPGLIAHCYHRFHYQYFHWLVDVMPRIWLLREHSPYAQPDMWFVGPLNHPFQQPMLALYGITPNVCWNVGPEVVAFEETVCTGFRFTESLGTRPAYSSGIHYKGWSPAFLNDIRSRARQRYMAGEPCGGHERLYVSRADALHRHVRNEREVRAVIERFGFEVIEPGRMTFDEQVRIFSQARIIVGAHGAGLANVIWASPGAELLEFMPEQLEDVGYRFLSTLAGHRHNCIVCRQFEHQHGPPYADIEVDIPVLRTALSNVVRQIPE